MRASPSESPDRLAAALRFAERGWPVLPCAGKVPLAAHGLHDATTDRAALERWWAERPEANIAIRTGAPSGLVVLDVDGDEGAEALRALEHEHGELPRTASIKTPRGGQHFYFLHPGGTIPNSAGKLGTGLDVRGDGGYVIAPPSPGYEPDEQAPLAEPPAWLVELIRDAEARRNGAGPVDEAIPEGTRNQTLASLAGSMRRRGMSPEAMRAALEIENRDRCQPPLPDRDVERIAGSVGRYPPEDPLEPPAEQQVSEPRAYSFTPLSSFAAHSYPIAEPLFGEPGAIYLPKGGLKIVYGAAGSGKSTWTVDGIAHLASGTDWLGIPVPRPVRFLVIENEGPPALFQQKLAAKQEGWEGPDWTENVHVYTDPWGKFDFSEEAARQAISAYCDEHGIDVVCANPTLGLGVAASGRPDETQQFVDWLRECGLWTTRAFWLLHHENKAREISGDWDRHPDTLVLLQPDGERQRTKLTWKKARWATLGGGGRPWSVMLDWQVETESYTVTELDTVGASDEELVERLTTYLDDHPATATRQVLTDVEGTNGRLRQLLEGREEFDFAEGPRGAKLWVAAATVSGGEPTQ